MSIVLRSVGNGPYNAVVPGQPGSFSDLACGMEAHVSPGQLLLGETAINFVTAQVWEPRPQWEVYRSELDTVCRQLPTVISLSMQHAPPQSLLSLLVARQLGPSPASSLCYVTGIRLAMGAELVRTGWTKGLDLVRQGAAYLAGAGRGLTPAGDDFLHGAMLGAWLAHPDPQALCRLILQTAVPRTTTLSVSYLRAAARGECGEPWHLLLHGLSSGGTKQLAAAIRRILARGATSGADALAGFVWVVSISE